MEDLGVMKRLLMLISAASMIGMAAPAYADPVSDDDAGFLKQLTDAGVTYKDPVRAVAVAKDVCDLANKGTSGTDIKTNLEQRNSFSENGAAKFITLAALEYCPKQLPDGGQPAKSPGAAGN